MVQLAQFTTMVQHATRRSLVTAFKLIACAAILIFICSNLSGPFDREELQRFGENASGYRIPTISATAGLLVFLYFFSVSLPLSLALLLFGAVASNGEWLWNAASGAGYGLSSFVFLVLLYVAGRGARSRIKVAAVAFFSFALALWYAGPVRLGLPTDYFLRLGQLFGLPRAWAGGVIFGFGAVALGLSALRRSKTVVTPLWISGMVGYSLSLALGMSQPFLIPFLFFVHHGLSLVSHRPMRQALLGVAVIFFIVGPLFYQNESFDQRALPLEPAKLELLVQARVLQTESWSACFDYAGDDFDRTWLRHFATRRGTPALRECKDIYSYLLFWGDLASTDYTRTHRIVFQKDKGYLLAPARQRR